MNNEKEALNRLQKHIIRLAEKIEKSITEASEKYRGNPESVANAREVALKGIIKNFFPFPYNISKGIIFDSYGKISLSIDCVICAPNHPYFPDEDGKIGILLVDGIHDAIELKPDLKDLPDSFSINRKQKPEIIRCLEQISSLKKLRRKSSGLIMFNKGSDEYHEYAYRCPSYVFSYDSKELLEIGNYIAQYYKVYKIPLQEQFDVLYILKKGILINNKCKENSLSFPSEGIWKPHISGYNHENCFALFLMKLINELGPEANISEPVLLRYLKKMDLLKSIFGIKTFN